MCGQTDGWTDRLTLSTVLVEEGAPLGRLTVADNSNSYLGLRVMCQIDSPDFNQIWIFTKVFMKVSNTKFYLTVSSGSDAEKCRRTDRQKDGRT